jgi:hypothetical protein
VWTVDPLFVGPKSLAQERSRTRLHRKLKEGDTIAQSHTEYVPRRPTLRTLIEGRFVDNRPASARFRFRPCVEYTLPLRKSQPPVLVVHNEFFLVPGNNPFANGGSSYTQNRFQVGVRLPIADSFSVRPYYLLQSVNLPTGWDTNEIFGISLAFRVPRKSKVVRSRQPSCDLPCEVPNPEGP